ncbi:MAG: MBL fold metallo-hydrolase [Oligoflexia bacterium]|nr:MBL fold metallo-hydrolase [Oligoflexia bacterium]
MISIKRSLFLFVLSFFILLTFIVLLLYNLITPSFRFVSIDVTKKGGMQGDAHLLLFSDTINSKSNNKNIIKHILIDTGHFEDKDTLINFLKKREINHLDKVIITHAHVDHYGGLKYLLDQITVNEIYFNFPTEKQCMAEPWGCDVSELNIIKEKISELKIKYTPIKEGEIFKYGENLNLEILYVHDGISTPVGATDINDMSAIILVRDGKLKFLFAGDLNSKFGEWITNNDKKIEGSIVDVMKVPHHGANSLPSKKFFDRFLGKDAIITAPKSLWENERCKEFKDIALKSNHKVNLYVNGIHGNIEVRSYFGYFYLII